MDINALMESMASFKQDVPGEIRIFELRSSSIDELRRRLPKLLKKAGDVCEKEFDRGDWTTYEDRTLVRLPQGAHAVVYHASGAIKLATGLTPMEFLFKHQESKETLAARTEKSIDALGLRQNLSRGETLT